MIKMEEQKAQEQTEPSKSKQKATVKVTKQNPQKGGKIFVVRVRGNIRIPNVVKDTLAMLRLYKVNYCVVLDTNATTMGMIKKAKDFITWGPVDSKTEEELFAKRGMTYKGPLTDAKKKIQYKRRYVEHKGNKYKKFFKLNPPRSGYGRGGIKAPFSRGGALGDRGEKINKLVQQMM
jgi:large subunit ribosomal protein L30